MQSELIAAIAGYERLKYRSKLPVEPRRIRSIPVRYISEGSVRYARQHLYNRIQQLRHASELQKQTRHAKIRMTTCCINAHKREIRSTVTAADSCDGGINVLNFCLSRSICSY